MPDDPIPAMSEFEADAALSVMGHAALNDNMSAVAEVNRAQAKYLQAKAALISAVAFVLIVLGSAWTVWYFAK